MNDNYREKQKSNILRIGITVVVFLFALSVCILGILFRGQGAERSIGGFLDISPDSNRYTKFAIIGGRVFYPNKEAKDYTFPRVPPEEMAIENSKDESEEIITLQEIGPMDETDTADNTNKTGADYYSITRYPLRDNRSRDFRDEVELIELLTLTEEVPQAWEQEADIDLFRNEEGRIEKLSPGSEGFFRFQLNNKSGAKIHAYMTVYEPEHGIHLPMIFSLEDETNNVVSPETTLETGDTVRLDFNIDKDNYGIYRLNWRWPYESGNDEYDGAVGNEAGKYILKTTIYAETID